MIYGHMKLINTILFLEDIAIAREVKTKKVILSHQQSYSNYKRSNLKIYVLEAQMKAL